MFLERLLKDKKNIWLVIVLGALAGLLALWLLMKTMRPVVRSFCTYVLDDSDEKGARQRNRMVNIEAAVVKIGTMTKRIATVGKLKANADVTIKSEANGRIKDILFVEGASVEKDQVIIKFEDADVKADVKKAEAELVLAKADFERISKLHEQKYGSTKDFDKAKAQLIMAEGQLESAQARLDKTVIKAPFAGTIGLINVSAGAYVQAAQELVTLVDSTPMKVDFKVPEKNVHDVGVGQMIEVRIDAFKDRIFNGILDAVDAKVESESHSFAVRGSIPNDNGLLKAGLFANISLIIGEKGDTIVVDESSVDREGEIEFVWIIEKGKAMRRRVLTGTREDGKIEIVAGLRSGEIVVTVGQIKLADGVRVRITNMEEKKDAPTENKEEKASEKPTAEKPATDKSTQPTETTSSEKKDETSPQQPASKGA